MGSRFRIARRISKKKRGITKDLQSSETIDESRICSECGGVINHDDVYLPGYGGFCYCLCHEITLEVVRRERERLSIPSKNIAAAKLW